MKFATYIFDLLAYCNLAIFHDEFNIQSDFADNGSVNEYVYVSMYV